MKGAHTDVDTGRVSQNNCLNEERIETITIARPSTIPPPKCQNNCLNEERIETRFVATLIVMSDNLSE